MYVHSEGCVLDGDKKLQSLLCNNKQDVRHDDTLSVHSSSHLSVDYNSGNCNNFDMMTKALHQARKNSSLVSINITFRR